ncbi:hypothetical protein DICSQDRAFT_80679 [Dichomitus squalens LYAD-421 SS1]|uniref:uncharacterized protein n=1 Tax=Dichomitus squalens (strain LYAD-421) TaxID=732165 RepID=UPI00044110F5|nr:uncharacterized protein DICSQDRAFT_80679 [Dichomitus squalens LYAD-421 SS1]EJF64890.1 hypothetical protein DICSQDRAFT_80679 [Dichomitus squalens LYAD-421 SS1]
MDPGGPEQTTHLNWGNVGLAFSFVLLNGVLSTAFGLGVGSGLLTAAIRCVVQLSVVALILQKVFETQNSAVVAAMAILLNLMGTIETVVNKSKKRYDWMFVSVFLGMLGSTIPVSIVGARFAMGIQPFWKPEQYIPIVGMLCGSTISGIVVSVTYVLKEIYDNRDKVEMYLAFGASRFEACKPVARDALRLALTPNINQMSVIGIIAIPGMMTGAILGGSSVEQAARLQMVIMFMISSSTALASIATTILALGVVVDAQHRVRTDRIDTREHAVWRARNWALGRVVAGVRGAAYEVVGLFRRGRGGRRGRRGRRGEEGGRAEDRERLLG